MASTSDEQDGAVLRVMDQSTAVTGIQNDRSVRARQDYGVRNLEDLQSR